MSGTQRRLVWLATLLGLATASLIAQPPLPRADETASPTVARARTPPTPPPASDVRS